MRLLGTVIRTLFLLSIILFGALNMKMVDIVYFYGEQYVVKVPLFVAMISALLFGLILAWFLTIKEKMALKKEIKKLNRDLKAKEAEIKRIRNLPLLEESDIETQEVKK